jgi:hypothetical protein
MSPRLLTLAALCLTVTPRCFAETANHDKLYILQANDIDPTSPTSQPEGRWYHWLGCDPAITHLETGIAIDSGQYAGRGQRITVGQPSPIHAVQVKIKRIGQPGPLCWEAGTAWGRNDLGTGQIAASSIHANYEHFVTLPLQSRPTPTIYLRLRAASGQCPADYYAVYATWKEDHSQTAKAHGRKGSHPAAMMFRALREDPHGAALAADGTPIVEGASMMTRLLTVQPGKDHRELLPKEEDPYAFVESLAAGCDPRKAGLPWPDLHAEPGEIRLDGDWQLQVAAPHSPQVDTAVADLEGFLRRPLKRPVATVWEPSAKPRARTITLTQGPDLPEGPRRSAGYRYVAGADGVQIHGYDARGVMRGVWYLEDLMMLRGGPILKPDARTREPRYSPRATCSAWGGMGELATPAPVYTDAHLALISHYGYDAIWLGWEPGPERDELLPTAIPPGRTPKRTSYQPYLAKLRDLTERADRYGLEVVIQYVVEHPANDTRERVIRERAKQFVRDVPKIHTIVLLDEGMGSSAIRGSFDKRMEAWVATCNLLAKAFYEARPDVNVVAWRYTFASLTPDLVKWDQQMARFCRMDHRVAYMGNFDANWMRRRDGLLQYAYDYCLSLKAPSEDFRHAAEYLLKESQRDNLPPRPLYAHIESRFSQESNTQPEIPCMQRWIQRYQAVNDFQTLPIKGMIANWYHQGFYPTVVTELFGWWSYTNGPPAEELLDELARRDFGPAGASAAVDAWAKFSEAIWHYPFWYGLSSTMNAGLAQPFWLDSKAVNPRPWRRGFVNSLKELNLPASAAQERARLKELQRYWNEGLLSLHRAVEGAPSYVRSRAEDHWRIARSFGDKIDVTVRLVRWLDARDKLEKAKTPADAAAALDELETVGREELAAAKQSVNMYLCDSRMGHLNHGRGCFTAMSILTKIQALEKTLNKELPALRQKRIASPERINPKEGQ